MTFRQYERLLDQVAPNLTSDEKAEALWSISKTMQARGNSKNAITNIEQAIEYANAPALRLKLEQQLKELESL